MIYAIPFTRFTLPDGRQSEDSMNTEDPEVAAAYERIRAAGYRMTVELLRSGNVSASIECPEGDYDCTVHTNGPGLSEAIGIMMKRFDATEAAWWRESMRSHPRDEL